LNLNRAGFARPDGAARFATFLFVAFQLDEQRDDRFDFGRVHEVAVRVHAAPASLLAGLVVVPLHLVAVGLKTSAFKGDFVARAPFVGCHARHC
jgi:hypothetical protein